MNVSALDSSVGSASDLPSGSVAEQNSDGPSSSTAAADTVELSETAQATALHQQGESVKEIASNLGVTTQVVNGYLGITTTAIISGGGGGAHAPAPVETHNTSSESTSSQSPGPAAPKTIPTT
jgi:hypothetical protein